MNTSSYLKLSRHNVYIFRRRIPKSLLEFFKTNELRISTKTSDKKTAIHIARLIANESDLFFERLKNNKSMAKKKDFTGLIKELELWKVKNEFRTRLDEESNLHIQEVIENRRQIRELKESHKTALNQQEVGFKLALEAVKGSISENDNNHLGCPKEDIKLSDLVIEFFSPNALAKRQNAVATIRKDRDSLTLFIKIVGDKNISQVSQSDASLFSDKCLDFGCKNNGTRSVSTVNNYMNSISKFSAWVASSRSETGHIKLDFSELRYKKSKKPSEERAAFTEAEVLKILEHPQLSTFKIEEPVKFWLPHIAAFTGARLEEITQLSPITDIYIEDGVWVIDINNKDEKSVKNLPSVRRVPIHSHLIKIGFIEYVETMKIAKANTLFPNEKIRDGRTGKNAGKRVNRFINQVVGIENKSLHSFRHTFATLLKRAGVQESIAAELMGHKHGGVTYDRYGKGFLSETLKTAVELVNFDL